MPWGNSKISSSRCNAIARPSVVCVRYVDLVCVPALELEEQAPRVIDIDRPEPLCPAVRQLVQMDAVELPEGSEVGSGVQFVQSLVGQFGVQTRKLTLASLDELASRRVPDR